MKGQLDEFCKKQRELIYEAKSEMEEAMLTAMWAGFMNGLYLSKAISKEEYDTYFDCREKEILKHAV